MGYPYDKTYLEQIQENKEECARIREAYRVLERKYLKDHDLGCEINLTIPQMFSILGEAFENSSSSLDGITDEYHFIGDVIDALLTPKTEEETK